MEAGVRLSGMWLSSVSDFADQLWNAFVEYAVQDWHNDEREARGAHQAADDHGRQLSADDSTSTGRCNC